MKIAWLALFSAMGCLGQTPQQSVDGYLESVFLKQFGEVPRMGWFVPEYGFVARESRAAELTLLGPLGTDAVGRRNGKLMGRPWGRRAEYGVACELGETDTLGVYRVDGERTPRRALYLSRMGAPAVRRGLVMKEVDGAVLARVNRLLGWPEKGGLRRDKAFGESADSPYSYSRHRLYDPKTRLLQQEAIVLVSADGKIVAHEVLRDIDTRGRCDGCELPHYSREVSGEYLPLQIFDIPGFAYPVLLLDSSTFEGEALSLLTVTPAGKVTSFRVYEYDMHCQ